MTQKPELMAMGHINYRNGRLLPGSYGIARATSGGGNVTVTLSTPLAPGYVVSVTGSNESGDASYFSTRIVSSSEFEIHALYSRGLSELGITVHGFPDNS